MRRGPKMDEQIKELMALYGLSDEQAREALRRLAQLESLLAAHRLKHAQIDARLHGVA